MSKKTAIEIERDMAVRHELNAARLACLETIQAQLNAQVVTYYVD